MTSAEARHASGRSVVAYDLSSIEFDTKKESRLKDIRRECVRSNTVTRLYKFSNSPTVGVRA